MTFKEQFGIWLAVYAIASGVLSLFDLNFTILMWMEAFGSIGAWICRVALLALGIYFYRAGDPID